MKIKGYRLLLKVKGAKTQISDGALKGFKLIHDDATQRMENSGSQTALVLDVGETCWKGGIEQEPWCKKGDNILFSKHASRFIHIPGELSEDDRLQDLELAVINDTDVILNLDEKEDEE